MKEVEVKIRIVDPVLVRNSLIKGGAVPAGTEYQKDVYLNSPVRDFRETDEAFRVRFTGEGSEITYKGPKKILGGVKSRDEISVPVHSGDEFIIIMEHLSFIQSGVVSKRREEFTWKDAIIALDDVEGLGAFVEIEILTESDEESAMNRIREMREYFDIQGDDMPLSYLEMISGKVF